MYECMPELMIKRKIWNKGSSGEPWASTSWSNRVRKRKRWLSQLNLEGLKKTWLPLYVQYCKNRVGFTQRILPPEKKQKNWTMLLITNWCVWFVLYFSFLWEDCNGTVHISLVLLPLTLQHIYISSYTVDKCVNFSLKLNDAFLKVILSHFRDFHNYCKEKKNEKTGCTIFQQKQIKTVTQSFIYFNSADTWDEPGFGKCILSREIKCSGWWINT